MPAHGLAFVRLLPMPDGYPPHHSLDYPLLPAGNTPTLCADCGTHGAVNDCLGMDMTGARASFWILLGAALVLALSLGIRHGFGLFLAPMSQEFGWGREVFALAIALQNLVWGLSQPYTGANPDRFGAARVVLVDPESREESPVAGNANVDPAAYLFSSDERELLAVGYMDGVPNYVFVNREHPESKVYAGLINAFPDRAVRFGGLQFGTNFSTQPMLVTTPLLAAQGGGAILNVLSVASWINSPLLAVYGASKSAAWGLTNGLRNDLRAQGTQVLGLHMGFVDTDLTSGLDMPKSSPEAIVRRAFDALEAGAEEVLADDFTQQVKRGLSAEPAVYLSAPRG